MFLTNSNVIQFGDNSRLCYHKKYVHPSNLCLFYWENSFIDLFLYYVINI